MSGEITVEMDLQKYILNNSLKIIVRPNSNQTGIVGYDSHKEAIKVNISEPADKNKANKEIINFFSRLLEKKVTIKSGLSSREKLLKVE